MINADEILFSTIRGHGSAVARLQRAIEHDRVAHAYMFVGPNGVGKRRCATAFAAGLLDGTKPEADPSSASSRKLVAGNHPDFWEVRPEGQFIKKDAVAEMIRRCQFAPFESDWKVFLIHDAHRMNPASANALLKTLEEPPSRTVIVLLTSAPQQILPTIHSRCQKIPFAPLPAATVAEILRGQGVDADEAEALARLSEGSVGQALEMDEAGATEGRKAFGEAFFSLRHGKDLAALEMAKALNEWPGGPEAAMELMKSFLADAVRVSAGVNETRLVHRDLADEARRFAERYDAEVLATKIRSVTYAQRLLQRNANKLLTAEALMLDVLEPAATDFAARLPR
ncbi:MAG: DNA polymerase III subunit delta' [Deltaproteobacteria bacterium]|nr:DNA polymerase III subunit delta' [Deltaproteobacteria bacterium]